MKKQSLHLLFIFLFCTLISSAQEYSFGVKGGVNYNQVGDLFSIGGSIQTGTPNVTYTPGSEMGTQFGAFLNFRFDRFFIRPEIMMSTLKSTYEFPTKPGEWEAKRLDVPLLFGYTFYHPVSVYVGPTFSGITDLELTGPESPIDYKESSMGINIGVLVDFDRFGVDIRYEYGLSKVEEQRVDVHKAVYGVNLADLLEYNPSQFMISVHVNIFRLYGGERNRRFRSDWRNHRNL
jgi:hypothetical protein